MTEPKQQAADDLTDQKVSDAVERLNHFYNPKASESRPASMQRKYSWRADVSQHDSDVRAMLSVFVQLADRVEALERKTDDQLETAWTIIANAGGGNWATQSSTWRAAACRWRDEVMPGLSVRASRRAHAMSTHLPDSTVVESLYEDRHQ